MRIKSLYWILGIATISILFIYSCTKLDENQDYVESPFISFIEFDGADTLQMISQDDTVKIGVPFGIFISTTSNLSTKEDLKELKMSLSNSTYTTDSVYVINDTKYSKLFVFHLNERGLQKIMFTVKDKAHHKASRTINVFIKEDKTYLCNPAHR